MINRIKKLNDSFLQENKYIFKKYKPIQKIGKGSFGNIYSTIRLKDKNVFAMKTEKLKMNNKTCLESEAYYLYILQGFGFPKLISFGHTKNYNILIETLLDKSLEDLYFKKRIKSNIVDICLIGIQILDRLEWIHSKDIVYRDIKPENFLLGIDDPNVLYIIDFGLCKKYRSSKTGKHILPKISHKFNGNFQFASINVTKGKEYSRRDDLISLGYMLIFLLKKELPWDNIVGKLNASKYFELIYLKESNGCGKLFRNVPDELIEYFKYSKNLKFEQEPNYVYLRSLLNKIIINLKFNYEKLVFSWINFSDKTIIRASKSNSKRKSSPYFRLLQNIKEERLKRVNSDSLNEQKLINKLNKYSCSDYKLTMSNRKENTNILESDGDILKNNKIPELNLINHFNKGDNYNKINKNKKITNNIKILNVLKINKIFNNEINKNDLKEKKINTISYLSYYNNIVKNKNKKIKRISFPNTHINKNNIIINNQTQNNQDYTYLNSQRAMKAMPIANYLLINKNSISKVRNKKINISNDILYKSPLQKLFKNNIINDYSSNNCNDKKLKNNQNIHKKYINLIFSKRNKSIDLGISNKNKNNRMNKKNDFSIVLINNNINYLTNNSQI